jgi:dCMP deaminase
LNSVFEIESKLTEDILYIREVSTRLQFVGINPKDIIKVKGEPRHIERLSEKRLSKDEYYLGIAKQVASRSTCLRRKYGAIIVRNDVIISTGYNGSPRGEHNCSDKGLCVRQVMNMAHNSGDYSLCRSVHAEQNAIINAARQGTSLLGGTLYLYGYDCTQKKTIDATPCPICNRMIQNSGIKSVVSSKETEE